MMSRLFSCLFYIFVFFDDVIVEREINISSCERLVGDFCFVRRSFLGATTRAGPADGLVLSPHSLTARAGSAWKNCKAR